MQKIQSTKTSSRKPNAFLKPDTRRTPVPYLDNPKWLPLDKVVEKREALRVQGQRVVLVNGCFDLLHTGHLYFLQQAAALGDVLMVALNGERSVRLLKGPLRPVQGDEERAYALAALACVQLVLTFDTPRLTAEIQALRPDVYAKAGDYTLETLDAGEREALQQGGCAIHFVPFLKGFSTTSLIARIAKAGDL